MDAGMTRTDAPVEPGRLSGGRRLALIGVAVVSLAAVAFAIGRGVASDSDSGGGTASGAATTAASAASGSGTAATIADFAFSPQPITVKVGGAVTWTNKDGTTHTVTSDDGSFKSPDLAQGATFTANFKTAGTFAYICSIHTFMKGSVVVQP
jgi:plastocyanin